uniref:Uncharacterized protein n=1 Tax=Chromera velia CCMP2878 TaxID=1169474 RepID=A0A0G4FBE1_9ALVE|eukprot:Cvel_16044.t1-p1 / transcript=Cvel_16044.t1 / gene=Cvel_16044 / organism=Chromera_velia_CCMP2878 / gene_product=hypothetical protein / transcript_product=hypothetical protein / location=Cvel_scaffold1219:4035-6550(+) / protein_length=440 / sequence_SO=supercontig / SO=protein_coding / is_pseudo=false
MQEAGTVSVAHAILFDVSSTGKSSLPVQSTFSNFKHYRVVVGQRKLLRVLLTNVVGPPCVFFVDAMFSESCANFGAGVLSEVTDSVCNPASEETDSHSNGGLGGPLVGGFPDRYNPFRLAKTGFVVEFRRAGVYRTCLRLGKAKGLMDLGVMEAVLPSEVASSAQAVGAIADGLEVVRTALEKEAKKMEDQERALDAADAEAQEEVEEQKDEFEISLLQEAQREVEKEDEKDEASEETKDEGGEVEMGAEEQDLLEEAEESLDSEVPPSFSQLIRDEALHAATQIAAETGEVALQNVPVEERSVLLEEAEDDKGEEFSSSSSSPSSSSDSNRKVSSSKEKPSEDEQSTAASRREGQWERSRREALRGVRALVISKFQRMTRKLRSCRKAREDWESLTLFPADQIFCSLGAAVSSVQGPADDVVLLFGVHRQLDNLVDSDL